MFSLVSGKFHGMRNIVLYSVSDNLILYYLILKTPKKLRAYTYYNLRPKFLSTSGVLFVTRYTNKSPQKMFYENDI